MLDGNEITEQELALALRQAACSRISSFTILAHSRTDGDVVRSLSLAATASVILKHSKNKSVLLGDDDTEWLKNVCSLCCCCCCCSVAAGGGPSVVGVVVAGGGPVVGVVVAAGGGPSVVGVAGGGPSVVVVASGGGPSVVVVVASGGGPSVGVGVVVASGGGPSVVVIGVAVIVVSLFGKFIFSSVYFCFDVGPYIGSVDWILS